MESNLRYTTKVTIPVSEHVPSNTVVEFYKPKSVVMVTVGKEEISSVIQFIFKMSLKDNEPNFELTQQEFAYVDNKCVRYSKDIPITLQIDPEVKKFQSLKKFWTENEEEKVVEPKV